MEKDYIIQPLKPLDRAIMDQILQEKQWTKAQLEMINTCRLYLQVMYISELADSATKLGKQIQQSRTKGTWSRSTLNWPVQPDPGKQAWKIWNKALRILVREDGETLKQAQHKDWLQHADRYRKWKYMYDDMENCIYEDDGRWYKLEMKLRRKLIFKIQELNFEGKIHPRAIPMHPKRYRNTLVTDNTGGTQWSETRP